ncbi:ABC transporter substrate-binding protein [Paenibacillus sacheonensis]|uniref:Extracellular solute-binding protein n=1 Tax=Paenibacillus sacheonensis TaxID=742054 RepID=A0A7X4YNE7_9BACL|nr:hypothetical protein [Paenibacillus sacheonensis]MBM7565904.1 multiple sugar transport system substrate-binding protein [Paenibacillus sacheonensis]NBC68781.1 hypothetical protein [Paenibacillus sacheonensis]
MKEPVHDWERRLAGKPPVKNGFTSELERKVRERIRMNTTKRKSPLRAAAAGMSFVLLLGGGWLYRDDIEGLLRPAATSDVPAALSKDPLADKAYRLKVQQFEQMNTFEYYLKKPFVIRHPSVRMDMLNASYDLAADPEKFEAWFDSEQPDFVQIPMNVYAKLAADGKLKPLDALIKEDRFDLGTLHAPLVDYLRQAGGSGELYGLSADYGSSALYVNEDVFAAKGVPLPAGELTIGEILQLAQRFEGTGVNGLSTADRSNTFAMAQLIGQTTGLRTLTDADGRLQATVDSDAWRKVWTEVADGYNDGWINQSKPIDYGKGSILMKDLAKQDTFVLGQAAMAIKESYYYQNLETYEQEGVKTPNWSTVPIHVDASASNPDAFLNTQTVYAINAASTQTDAAWELLRYVVGGSWRTGLDARNILARQLMANKSVMNEEGSKHWQAFYDTKVDPVKAAKSMALKSSSSYIKAAGLVYKLGGEAMDAVLKGTLTVDQALGEFQQKLDVQLAGIGKEAEK